MLLSVRDRVRKKKEEEEKKLERQRERVLCSYFDGFPFPYMITLLSCILFYFFLLFLFFDKEFDNSFHFFLFKLLFCFLFGEREEVGRGHWGGGKDL